MAPAGWQEPRIPPEVGTNSMIEQIDCKDVRMWVVDRDEARNFRLAHRAELDRPGLYVLVGDSDGTLKVYVGEGIVFRRVRRQTKRRDFWQRAALIVSDSGRLNKAHIWWLEAQLIELLRASERYELVNLARAKRDRPPPYLHPIDIEIVEQFLAGVRMALAQANVIDV